MKTLDMPTLPTQVGVQFAQNVREEGGKRRRGTESDSRGAGLYNTAGHTTVDHKSSAHILGSCTMMPAGYFFPVQVDLGKTRSTGSFGSVG